MVTPELQLEVERFLYHEAALLDGWQMEEWLALFTEDASYHMPVRETITTPARAVGGEGSPPLELPVIDDRLEQLRLRIARLGTGLAHAETPHSRTRHCVTNVMVTERDDGELDVDCNIIVYQSRLERIEAWYAGRRHDRLRRVDGELRIARREVVLDQRLLPRTLSILF